MIKTTFESNGLKLAGVYHPSTGNPPRAVIISHGFAGSKNSDKWKFICDALAAAGRPAFRFDHSGIGESEGLFEDVTLTRRITELKTAVAFTRGEFGAAVVALLGSSFGGVTTLFAATDPVVAPACSIICATPFNFDFFNNLGPEFTPGGEYISLGDGVRVKRALVDDADGYDIAAQAARVSKLMVMHGTNDELIPPDHARSIFDRAADPKHLALITGADHAFTQRAHQSMFLNLCSYWFSKLEF